MKTINSFRSKLLALTLALMVSVSTFAYKSQWCDTWNVMWFDGMRFDETASTSQYRLGKDTVIGDYTYSKFTSRTSVRFTDDRKVYVYYEGFDDNDPYTEDLPTGEYLAYDFSAQVGDTLEVFSGVGTYSTYPCVVDDVQIDSETNLRTMTLHQICRIDEDEYDDQEITWIECVGSPEGFLISSLPCGWVGGGTYALLCAYQGDELKYTGDLYDEYGCEYNATEQKPEDLFPTLAGLQRTHTIEMYDYAPNDGKRSGGYPLSFAPVKDTVINGKTYLQFGDYVNGSNYSLFFLREENNKVLIYSSILQEDLVLYDYTLKLGDSLPAITSDHDYFSDDHFTKLDKAENIFTYVVTDISTVTLLDGIERKKWILKNKYLPIIEYVEGIGCYGENTSHSGDFFRLIHDHPYTTEYVGDHLVCVSKNGQLLYSMTQEEMDGFTLTCECLSQEDTIDLKDLFPTLWGLQRTTCTKTIGEDEYGTVWGSRSYLMQEIQTTTIDGKQYIVFGDEYDRFALREENNKILVYSSILKKDLVLYDFTLEVGDSLPALYYEWRAHNAMQQWLYNGDIVDYNKDDDGTILPAETFVVTDISTITLLDGKECKKWTFDNGMEYVEGIGSFGTSYAWNDFYQLIANVPLSSDVHSQYLVCASRNNKLLYQMDEAEMERLGTECLCEVETSYKSQWCDTWNILVKTGSVHPPVEETYRYQLAKDTVIGDYTYTAVVSKAINDALDAPHYVAAVRFTDDRKVYIYYDNAEYLLYDFNVQEGDELEVFAGINNYTSEIKTYKCTVTGVEQYACIGCPATITLHVPNHPDDITEIYRRTQWQEGVGDVYSGLLNGVNGYVPVDGGGSVHYLLCAYKGDELKYTGMFHENYGCGDDAEQTPEDLFPTLWGLQRTSCDEWYDGCGENKSYLFAPKEVKEINGKLYLKCGGVFLREEDSKVLIYSFPYEKDFVLYDYTLEVGGTLQNLGIDIYSFPELEYAAVVDYMAYEDYDVETDEFIIKKEPLGSKRVQEVSTITLLDGKEYKRWLFGNDWENGDYYIEGIGNVGGSFGGDYIDIANPYGIPTCYLGERLVCASKNGQLLYQMDDAEMERLGAECLCDYDRGPLKDNAKNGKIGGRPTPTQWNQLELDLREMENGNTILRAETFSYTLENDSIVANNKTYYQLARQSTKDTAITKSFVGALHFGEDEDNRVYFLRDGVEYVLYDFTAEPGDTVEIFAGINNYPQETTYTHVVVDKDTTEDGACRMFLEVVFPDETTTATNTEKVWLAGLGSIDGIVHNAAKRTSDAHAAPAKSASSETQTSVMLCAWREDSCLYTTNHPEYDTFGCVYNQDPTAVEDVETLGTQYQKILRDGHLYILRDNKLYDVLGTPMN